MRKKLIAVFLAAVLCLLCLAGCEGKPLPDGMDEQTLLSSGQEVVDLLMEGEYEAVHDLFRDDIQSGLTVDNVKNLMESETKDAGNFERVKDTLTTGSTEGEPHGIAVIYCEYSEENVRYRVAFDPDMNLIGLEIGQN